MNSVLYLNKSLSHENNILKREDNTLYFKLNENDYISFEQLLAIYLKHLIKMSGPKIDNS